MTPGCPPVATIGESVVPTVGLESKLGVLLDECAQTTIIRLVIHYDYLQGEAMGSNCLK
jgi:hypothetical protein